MKIAWFTPLGCQSAIGQYGARVLQELGRTHQVVAYASDATSAADCWEVPGEIRLMKGRDQAQLLGELKAFDIVIYNMGDNLAYHQSVYETSLNHPGILILHDLVLHHFFAGYFLYHLKDTDAYIRQMGYAHGRDGEELAKLIMAGRRTAVWDEPEALTYHMAKPAVYRKYGIVVHSEYAKRQLDSFATAPVKKIHFPEPGISAHFRNRPAARNSSARDRIKILTFGNVNPNKMIELVVETIGSNEFLKANVDYTIIGGGTYREYRSRIESLIAHYGLAHCVHLIGHQPDDVFVNALRDSDIVINLRNPYLGEASWSLLEALYAGKPTVVWRHGYYDEHPDCIVAKVTGKEDLTAVLCDLSGNHAARLRRAQASWDYAREHFSTKKYCRELLEFIESARLNKPVLDLVDSMCDRMLEMRADSSSVELIDVLQREVCQLARIA